ncbi:MAG: discoidin domain-containing protein [Deltaproteobacteria bacterium]|nr:discoidin domain-containing protein [Deltaproteobacteria bacterium]
MACACGRGTDAKQPAEVVGFAPLVAREAVLPIARSTASSSHPASDGYTYVPSNLQDGALTTSWQPAKTDKGPHWVRLELAETATVTAIAIANGFQTRDGYGDEFVLNSRIASARLRFDDGEEVGVHFDAGARGFVRFPVGGRRTRVVELLVDTTYAGTKWNDLAISEIEVTGVVVRSAVASALRAAVAVIDEPGFVVGAGGARAWTLPPGRYRAEATSRPNGMSLSWQGDVTCDVPIRGDEELTSVQADCTVHATATLRMKHPGRGSPETMSLHVARPP